MTNKTEEQIAKMYEQVAINAIIHGQGFLRFTSDGNCEVVDPKQYKELAEALLWAENQQVKL